MLQLPPTIRSARIDELPATPNNAQLMEQLAAAMIVPGFTFHYNELTDSPFLFYAEINIDNNQLWNLFIALVGQLPENVCLLYHHNEESSTYSPYLDKKKFLKQLSPFETEITQDPHLCVGALYYGDDSLVEVYISDVKYIQYWGMDEQEFRDVMGHFGLEEIEGLQFIDEFPRVMVPLQTSLPGCLDTWEVLGRLMKLFGADK